MFASVAAAQQTPVPARITQPIDPTNLTVLKGNVHPLARPEFDQGPAPASLPLNRMLLVLQRSPAQETALESLLDAQQDKSSPNYHQWLTPQQFGQQFGPADSDVQTVVSWLQSQGFQIDSIANGRGVIEFSGTAAQVQAAFHTAIHSYAINGQTYTANSTDPQIPSALAPVVAGFVSLNNFPPKPMIHLDGPFSRSKSTGKITPLNPLLTLSGEGCGVSGNCYGIGPFDFATIYNVNPLWNATTPIDGTGETIAIVGETDINTEDVAAFRSFFGMPAPNLNVIHNGPAPGILTDGEETEADLDVEWSGAVAKGATIDFVVSQSTETSAGVDLSAQYIVDNDLAPIMSESYGECELGLGSAGNQFMSNLWEQAAAEGITVFVSAGDNGSSGCDNFNATPPSPAQYGLEVSGFASTPYNVAVGGTDFNDALNPSTYWSATNTPTTQQSALSYIPEEAWNNTCTNPIFASLGFTSNAETNCNTSNLIDFVSTIGGSGGKSACTTPSSNTPTSCSGGYAKPSWQTGSGVPGDGKRDLPDISLYAAGAGSPSGAGYIVCEADAVTSGSCSTSLSSAEFLLVGGTSASSPSFAGIMALVDQKMGASQGNANYIFYKLAAKSGSSCMSSASPASTCVLYDTPAGSTNAMACLTGSSNCTTSRAGDAYGVLSGYSTGTGYDQATGLGSVNAANLVNNWNTVSNTPSATTLTLNNGTAVNITHGSSVPVSVSVSPASPVPTGNVALLAQQNGTSTDFGTLTLGAAGSVSTNLSTLPGGTSYSVQAHYPGDANYEASNSNSVTVTVNPEASKTSLAIVTLNPTTGAVTNSNATSFAYGSPYILRSDVMNGGGSGCFNFAAKTSSYPCPTGSVAITDNSSALGPGTFTLNTEGYTEYQAVQLTGGSHTLGASYSGDNSYNASTTTDAVTVTPAATTTEITSGPGSTVQIGAPIVIYAQTQATSSGAVPTGTFTVFDGSTQLSTTNVSTNGTTNPSADQVTLNGQAQVSLSAPAGSHTLTVHYSGDSNYASSISAPVTVNAAYADTLSVTATPNTVIYGQNTSVTVTATLDTTNAASNAALKPTGSLTFNVQGTVTTSVSQDSSGNWMMQATVSFSPQQSGAISVNYAGDSNYVASNSSTFITVTVPDFSVSNNSGTLTITAGQTGNGTVTITPTTSYTSTVALACESTNMAGLTVIIPGSTCGFSQSSVTLSNSTAGTANFSLAIAGPSSTTTAFATPVRMRFTPVDSGGNIWRVLGVFSGLSALFLLACVRGRRRLRLQAVVALASICAVSLAVGCGGGGAAGGGGQKQPAATTTSLSASATKTPASSGLTLTATVTGASPTGIVTFNTTTAYCNSVNASLANGTAQVQLTGAPGTCAYTAQYNGDANNLGSQSGALNIVFTGNTSLTIYGTTGTDTHELVVPVTIQ
ncbi:MAG TPA: Ig-like domain repeat protein [Candidatus Acidoferrum sp.]|nr:Ig-like domain repeat protein [Candidatus Acidoferrum sp.]